MKPLLVFLVAAVVLASCALPALAGAGQAVRAAGAAALESLVPGQALEGFRAESVYVNHVGKAMGARFTHQGTGLPLDILFFASVPQASLYFKTLPLDDKGVPHALEHLVLGKGARGKHFNLLMDMSLGEYTAATYSDVTAYQFNVAAGMEDFYRVLETFLHSLTHPDFTDEEVRREVYNPEVVEDPGTKALTVEEKGTVYNEMVSSMEKAVSVNWDQFGRMVYGPRHPLALNQGGLPDEMRATRVEDVRGFHDANYRLGPNMGLIVALPSSEDPYAFLKRFGGIVSRVAADGAGRRRSYKTLPAFEPGPEGGVAVGKYPSTDLSAPQTAFLGWRPIPDLSIEDGIALGVMLDILGGGETSYLHKDMVDRQTRKMDYGITSVESFLDEPPANLPGLMFSGLPADSVAPARLDKLRQAALDRVRWMAGLAKGSKELAEVALKARSLLSSRRRQMLRLMDSPPHFGARSGGIVWNRHLDWLASSAKGFRKSVPQVQAFEALLSRIDAGENVWAGIAGRFQLESLPSLSAVRPDAGLLAEQKGQKESRLEGIKRDMASSAGGADEQEALRRRKAESDKAGRELEERDKGVARARFIKEPPLTLDDKIESREHGVAGVGKAVLNNVGDSPFTDIGLFFDLTGVPQEYYVYLPMLASAITGVGVTTPRGESLDYAAMIERFRQEIYSLSSDYAANPHTRRLELSLAATATDPSEIGKAVEWLENCMTRGSLGRGSRSRLVDMVREEAQSLRTIMQRREERWVSDAAMAYLYQDQPAWMSVRSPFTKLFHLGRLRWMLEDPSKEDLAAWRKGLADVEALAAKGSREDVSKAIAKLPAEMAEQLAWESGYLPEASWRSDLAFLTRQISADLGVGSKTAIAKLQSLRDRVLRKGNVRICLTGNEASMKEALDRVRQSSFALLGALPPERQRPTQVVLERLAGRPLAKGEKPAATPGKGSTAPAPWPTHVGLVNNATKSGVFVVSTPGPSYGSVSDEAAVDYLAANVFTGGAAHGFFMRTWAAGLAYSNGIGSDLARGRLRYYAERCPSLVATMSFVAGVAAETSVDDPFFVEYALANSFGDYRGAGDFASRGYAMGANLADGLTPDAVRAFKTRLLAKAAEPEVLRAVASRLKPVLGSVIIGLGGGIAGTPGAAAFVIGPEPLLAEYEGYLKGKGEGDKLVRLYPRDFWIP